MRKTILFLASFSFSQIILAQVPLPHNASNVGGATAERISNFGIAGLNNQRFEVTNGTSNDNEFLPALWSHNGVTNYQAIQHHATTTRRLDTGTTPLMMFISSVPTTVNLNAPSGSQFPWGNGGTQQTLNNRPTFAWLNGQNTELIII